MFKTINVIAAIFCLLLIGGLLLPWVMAAEGNMATPGDTMKPGDMMKSGKECTMKDMHGCMMDCTKQCEKNMKSTAEAIVSLDAAAKALDAGNTAEAKKDVEKANLLLKDLHKAQKKCMDKMPTANAMCPISGKKIDMMNTPESLTTLYQGKKVGFCCPACPPLWEKLTEQEKEQKLEKALSEPQTLPDKESKNY